MWQSSGRGGTLFVVKRLGPRAQLRRCTYGRFSAQLSSVQRQCRPSQKPGMALPITAPALLVILMLGGKKPVRVGTRKGSRRLRLSRRASSDAMEVRGTAPPGLARVGTMFAPLTIATAAAIPVIPNSSINVSVAISHQSWSASSLQSPSKQ